mmetsp:Transcript_50710/g.118895  ORF Transcript_50710/g.118895 Transcript_50710/m.118895 type:complete len:250 (+) Transcript_50710:642-1391(+)
MDVTNQLKHMTMVCRAKEPEKSVRTEPASDVAGGKSNSTSESSSWSLTMAMRLRTSSACCPRRCTTSHLGDSGMRLSERNRTMAGTVMSTTRASALGAMYATSERTTAPTAQEPFMSTPTVTECLEGVNSACNTYETRPKPPTKKPVPARQNAHQNPSDEKDTKREEMIMPASDTRNIGRLPRWSLKRLRTAQPNPQPTNSAESIALFCLGSGPSYPFFFSLSTKKLSASTCQPTTHQAPPEIRRTFLT